MEIPFSNRPTKCNEVEGQSLTAAGVLLSDRVELEGGILFSADDEGGEVEIEGFITRLLDSQDFDVAGVRSTTNGSTQYENGAELDLMLNVRVEIEGVVDANGIVVADEIEFKTESNLVVLATVDAVDGPMERFTLLGLEFATNSSTQFIDESDADIQTFSIAGISIGDFMKVKGVTDGSGVVVAALVKRINAEDEFKVEGNVSAINNPDMFIETLTITTDANTQFADQAELSISAAEFFNQLTVGTKIEVQGTSPSTGVLLATEVELE